MSEIYIKDNFGEKVFPRENEEFIFYRERITVNKEHYGLTWKDIKDLCLCFYNEKVSDNWRKFFYYKKEQESYKMDKNNRVLVISDVHVPFNLNINIFEKYINKVDTLVINGDLLDCYSMSKFTKMYRQPLIEELVQARQYVIDLVEYIKPKKVIAVTGNHEIRVGKMVADKIGTDLLDLLPTDAMAFLFDTGFNHHNHQTKSKTVYEPLCKTFEREGVECIFANNFWYKEGKTIFVHPLAFVNNPLGTNIKAYDYFKGLGIEFDTIVMAHTHQLAFAMHSNCYLFEQGCCADLKHMNYMDMRLPKRTQQNGYLYMVQDENGDLIYDKCKLESLKL